MEDKTIMRCTFAGHRDLQNGDIKSIVEALERITTNVAELSCYVGGMGEFDRLAEQAALTWRKCHPEKTLKLYLVLPYIKKEVLDKEKMAQYDEIIIPEEAEAAHYKRAITLRNHWMVDHSDVIIAKIWRNFGGAYNTVEYARNLKKTIFFIQSPNK